MPEPIPLASILSPDPFQAAAARTREAARPWQGRQEGAASYALSSYLPRVLQALGALPQHAMQEGANAYYAPEQYDPAPVTDLATMMVGAPLTPRGALGSSIARGTRMRAAGPAGLRAANENIGAEGPTMLDVARQEGYGSGIFSDFRGEGFVTNLINQLKQQRGGKALELVPQAPERIERAAINIGGKIYAGRNHATAIRTAENSTGKSFDELTHNLPLDQQIDGFLTSNGRFVSREEAANITKQSGQLRAPLEPPYQLIAEDVRRGALWGLPLATLPADLFDRQSQAQ